MPDFLISLVANGGHPRFMILIHEFGITPWPSGWGQGRSVFHWLRQRLIGFRKGETDYRIAAIPLGANVKNERRESHGRAQPATPRNFSRIRAGTVFFIASPAPP